MKKYRLYSRVYGETKLQLESDSLEEIRSKLDELWLETYALCLDVNLWVDLLNSETGEYEEYGEHYDSN